MFFIVIHSFIIVIQPSFNRPQQVNMHDEDWASPLCAAYVFKSFLMELPDPLLDKDLYEDFIKLTGKQIF